MKLHEYMAKFDMHNDFDMKFNKKPDIKTEEDHKQYESNKSEEVEQKQLKKEEVIVEKVVNGHMCVMCEVKLATREELQEHFRLHANSQIDMKGKVVKHAKLVKVPPPINKLKIVPLANLKPVLANRRQPALANQPKPVPTSHRQAMPSKSQPTQCD